MNGSSRSSWLATSCALRSRVTSRDSSPTPPHNARPSRFPSPSRLAAAAARSAVPCRRSLTHVRLSSAVLSTSALSPCTPLFELFFVADGRGGDCCVGVHRVVGPHRVLRLACDLAASPHGLWASRARPPYVRRARLLLLGDPCCGPPRRNPRRCLAPVEATTAAAGEGCSSAAAGNRARTRGGMVSTLISPVARLGVRAGSGSSCSGRVAAWRPRSLFWLRARARSLDARADRPIGLLRAASHPRSGGPPVHTGRRRHSEAPASRPPLCCRGASARCCSSRGGRVSAHSRLSARQRRRSCAVGFGRCRWRSPYRSTGRRAGKRWARLREPRAHGRDRARDRLLATARSRSRESVVAHLVTAVREGARLLIRLQRPSVYRFTNPTRRRMQFVGTTNYPMVARSALVIPRSGALVRLPPSPLFASEVLTSRRLARSAGRGRPPPPPCFSRSGFLGLSRTPCSETIAGQAPGAQPRGSGRGGVMPA